MKKIPISTVSINRCGLFLGKIENSNAWGKIECDTKLNQFHQDLIEATIYLNKGQIAKNGSGELWFKVSYYELNKLLELKNNYRLIDKYFTELQKALISMTKTIKHNDKQMTLLDRVAIVTQFKRLSEEHPSNISDKKTIAGVKFSNMFTNLYLENIDLKMYYNGKLLPQILTLKSLYAKALTRFMLTHSVAQDISKSKILDILGAENSVQKHRIWKYLNSSKSELELLDIKINENSVSYSINKNIVISNNLL
jgi:hypothetical protein